MSELTAETIDKIVELSSARHEGVLENLNADPRREYYRKSDGTIEEFERLPDFRWHSIDTIADFIAGLEAFVGEDKYADIFISDQSVVGILDTDDRRDRITLPLIRSEAWLSILMLNTEATYINQNEIMTLLRTTLMGAVSPDIVKICQDIKVVIGRHTSSTNTQGGRGLGNDVDAKVTGRENIPDVIELKTNVYQNPDLASIESKIATSFHVTPDSTFLMYPSKTEITKAISDNLNYIHEALASLGNDHYRIFKGEFLR